MGGTSLASFVGTGGWHQFGGGGAVPTGGAGWRGDMWTCAGEWLNLGAIGETCIHISQVGERGWLIGWDPTEDR